MSAFVARELWPSLTQVNRSYRFCRCRGAFFDAVLSVTQGKETDVYAVEETDPDGEEIYYRMVDIFGRPRPPLPPIPRFFNVFRCNSGPPDEQLYFVTISQGAGLKSSCRCFGFNRWQSCKHVDTLTDLIAKGIL